MSGLVFGDVGVYRIHVAMLRNRNTFHMKLAVEVLFETGNEFHELKPGVRPQISGIAKFFSSIEIALRHHEFSKVMATIASFTGDMTASELKKKFSRVPWMYVKICAISRGNKTDQIAQYEIEVQKLEDDSCAICLDKPNEVIIVPCGHFLCGDCRVSLRRGLCPFCRAIICKTKALEVSETNHDLPDNVALGLRKITIDENIERFKIQAVGLSQRDVTLNFRLEIDDEFIDQFDSNAELTPTQIKEIAVSEMMFPRIARLVRNVPSA